MQSKFPELPVTLITTTFINVILDWTYYFYLIHLHVQFKLILSSWLSFSPEEFKSSLKMYSICAISQSMKCSSVEISYREMHIVHGCLPGGYSIFSEEPDSGRTWKTADPSRLTFEIGIARWPIGVNRPSCRNARPWRNNDDCSFLVNRENSFRPQCIWSDHLESLLCPTFLFPIRLPPRYVKTHWQIQGTRTDLSRDQILFLSVYERFVVRSRNDQTIHSDENGRWNNLREI